MSSFQEYVVEESIEEYEAGAISRADLERRVLGALGDVEGRRVLAGVPERTMPSARRLATPLPIQGGAGVETQDVRIPIQGGELLGYVARPEGSGPFPAILAIHENRGLVDHTKDCARRLAAAGYVALAPDLLSRQGGTAAKFSDPNDAIAALGQSDPVQNTHDLVAALDWLGQQPYVDRSRMAVTGWCMGGGYTWRVVTQAGDRLEAAVPWYGPNPPGDVDKIQAPVFAIYGALDERINAGIDAITQQMQQNGKSFEKKIYPNAQHAFNNDQNPDRYNAEQAPVAWNDMLRFLDRHLKA
jgi:carboxymethylenebutenolidase